MGKEIECPYCKAHISKPEEKRTDVNISVRMIADAVADNADIFSLVSADSDLIPPINYIRANFPNKQVKVYFPPTNFSHDIRENSSTVPIRGSDRILSFFIAVRG